MDLWTICYIFSWTSWVMPEKFSWLVKKSAMSMSLRTPLRLQTLAMIILRIYKSIWLIRSGQMGLDIPEAGPDREESSSSSHSQTLIDPSCDPSTSCLPVWPAFRGQRKGWGKKQNLPLSLSYKQLSLGASELHIILSLTVLLKLIHLRYSWSNKHLRQWSPEHSLQEAEE